MTDIAELVENTSCRLSSYTVLDLTDLCRSLRKGCWRMDKVEQFVNKLNDQALQEEFYSILGALTDEISDAVYAQEQEHESRAKLVEGFVLGIVTSSNKEVNKW